MIAPGQEKSAHIEACKPSQAENPGLNSKLSPTCQFAQAGVGSELLGPDYQK